MITANLMGRLGNQMFQIAAAYSLAIDNDDNAVFPLIPQGTIPTAAEQLFYLSTVLNNVTYGYDFSWIKSAYKENSFSYSSIPYQKDMMIDGYFQSEKYFAHNSYFIKKLFSANEYIESRLEKYASICTEEFAAIHVRRGDYVSQSDTHTNLAENEGYYQKVLNSFSNKTKVIFSDDIPWCVNVFGEDCVYIANENDVVEMFLFSKIPNKAIANSSFSWWAAWLGEENSKEIIAPDKWFGPKNSHLDTSDIIPVRWTKL